MKKSRRYPRKIVLFDEAGVYLDPTIVVQCAPKRTTTTIINGK